MTVQEPVQEQSSTALEQYRTPTLARVGKAVSALATEISFVVPG